jgi:beta-glucanase (GH16 family)
MWYGNVQAKFKTSRGVGVVTAFILLSDVKDEIDYEFVGADLEVAQSNYYFQGIPDYDNEANITLSDTFENYHTYEIDWTPDSITWLVDGQVGRTKKRTDTWNASANQWDFPQTPARVQLSLWPAGLASNGEGTVAWAGGLVDWDSADIKNNGYYYASFTSVTVNCFNATTPPGTNTGVSYTYNGYSGTNDTVVDGKNATVLGSFLATGLDMDLGASASGAQPSSTAESIPGVSGGSPAQINSHGDTSSSSGSDSGSSTATGFVQGATGTSKSGADKLGVGQEKVLKGSVFAGIVAVVAMMAL